MVIVSHDRYLLRSVTDRWLLVADGSVDPSLAKIAGKGSEGVLATMTQTPEMYMNPGQISEPRNILRAETVCSK